MGMSRRAAASVPSIRAARYCEHAKQAVLLSACQTRVENYRQLNTFEPKCICIMSRTFFIMFWKNKGMKNLMLEYFIIFLLCDFKDLTFLDIFN